jgi:ubiquinone/menaquinone biosynthesis C-methylase UbiE
MTDVKDNPGYVDRNYLQQVGDWMRNVKQATYKHMHVAYGQHVLDVGCGPASDTLALSQLVGPQGKVVGVDYDAEMVRVANEKAQEAEVADYVTHLVTDAESLPFESETFHACRSERMFQHLKNPTQVLAEMVGVTKPGGWVVIADSDWSLASVDIPYTDFEWKLRRLLVEDTFNGVVGRQLYRLMKQAGLTAIQLEAMYLPVTEYEFWKMMVSFEDKVVQRGLARGIWTEAEVEQLNQLLVERDKQGVFFANITTLIVAGQKPADEGVSQ